MLKRFPKIAALFLIAVVMLALLFSPSVISEAFELELASRAALLMEFHSGEIVYAVNEHEHLYPASLTKIMTLLLALEAVSEGDISLTDEVPVTERAASMGGSQLFLSAGDVVDMESLLVGIAVGSGNDAAVAVAEYIAGGEEAFVERMNKRAEELGMKNTNFTNSTGLHDDGHYSTAYDVVLMGRELLTYPLFTRWSIIWMDENFLEGKIKSGKVYLSNTNRLVRYYSGCNGIKTGFTRESGHSIAASAVRNGNSFIAVVLNAPTSDIRYEEAKSLLNYGFANYYSITIKDNKENVARLPVEKGTVSEMDVVTAEGLSLLVKKGHELHYRTEIELPKKLHPPLSKGDVVGEIKVLEGDKVLKAVPLEVTQHAERASFFGLLSSYLDMWLRFGR